MEKEKDWIILLSPFAVGLYLFLISIYLIGEKHNTAGIIVGVLSIPLIVYGCLPLKD